MAPKPSPTHFLCLQLVSERLSQSLASFKADVAGPEGFGIPKDAVRPPGSLHLTLGVMSLNQEGLQIAVSLLQNLDPREILARLRKDDVNTQYTGLRVSFRGLHSTTVSSKSSVLYAPPSDTEGVLYNFCELLRKPFQQSGLIVEERPLLLHATVVNTTYARSKGGGRHRKRLVLDARGVLSKYADYVWVEDMPVTRAALCRMGAVKVEGEADEVYEVESEIEI